MRKSQEKEKRTFKGSKQHCMICGAVVKEFTPAYDCFNHYCPECQAVVQTKEEYIDPMEDEEVAKKYSKGKILSIIIGLQVDYDMLVNNTLGPIDITGTV
jgi:hypothetical protein